MRSKKLNIIENLKVDFWLFLALSVTMIFGLFVLYSASNQSTNIMESQIIKILLGFGMMVFCAQLNPQILKIWTPRVFILSIIILMLVPIIGEQSLGAKRWINVGIRFQPSEFIKFTLPMMLAWYISTSGIPKGFKKLTVCFLILIIPCMFILKQPDLGTALLVGASGLFVLFLSGISWNFILKSVGSIMLLAPLIWMYVLKAYQKTRITTMFNPEADPMGNGYHVIQSKIAIGSGGFSGSGWLQGSQSHLNFIPEQKTDFIFSVLGEELGLFGFLVLMLCYACIISRSFYIFFNLKETFDRLVTGALIMIFVCYIFVNIGMVSGILPVVGVPLPLISYGGTSIVSLMSSFGIISAFYHNQKLKSAKSFSTNR